MVMGNHVAVGGIVSWIILPWAISALLLRISGRITARLVSLRCCLFFCRRYVGDR